MPDSPTPEPPPPPVLPPRAVRHCLYCRYDLTGLGPEGECPECGRQYWVLFLDPARPDQVYLRLAWPLLGFWASAAAMAVVSPDLKLAFACCSAGLLLAMLLNTPLQVISLQRRHGGRMLPGSFTGAQRAVARLIILFTMLTLLLVLVPPLLLLGACLVL